MKIILNSNIVWTHVRNEFILFVVTQLTVHQTLLYALWKYNRFIVEWNGTCDTFLTYYIH